MIKMIQGTYGLRKGNSIITMGVQNGPFSIEKEGEEKRLVNLGVAVYVTEAEAEVAETETEAEVEAPAQEAQAEVAEAEVEAEEMTRDELIKAYKDLGLKGNPAVMKDETLKAKIAQAAELAEAEEAPTFNAVDGVVE